MEFLTKVAEGVGVTGAKGALKTLLTNRAAALSLNSENTLLNTLCATGSLKTFLNINVNLSALKPSLPLNIRSVLYASSRAGEGLAAWAAGAAALTNASERAEREKDSPCFCPCKGGRNER